MVDQRPSPDDVLQRTQEEERKERRGKLKIYLGAAPGVGKTYTMLHDALEKRSKNLDVVVGIVESHGRQDIEELLKNFEIIPRQAVEYRGKTWMELNVNASLHRCPGLILIDELAHTNAPGLLHEKRWQDISEFLDRGIDVYTTLNVQHIESLKDDIFQIIKVPIKETVPDSIIEMADTIELVDLPPDELLKRLQEGKVYIPQQAELAIENFFRKGNLIALRELALRTTAERVGADVLLYRQGEGIKQIWPTKEKILVCVGANPESLKLIRTAKRFANSLHADWIAVYVDTPPLESSTPTYNRAIQNVRLAELLGAETHILTGIDIVKEVLNFAREQNVTQIMISKQITNRWRDWFRRHLADEMLRYSGEIDIYIMTGESKKTPEKKRKLTEVTPWKAYGITFCVIGLATLFNTVLYPFVADSNLVMMYLLGVIAVALMGLRGPAIVASILSVITYAVLFTPPVSGSIPTNKSYLPTLVIMLLVTQIIGHLMIMCRRKEAWANINRQQTAALFTFSRQLSTTRGVNNLLSLGARYIANVFNCKIMAFLPKDNHLELKLNYQSKKKVNQKDQGIAEWVYEMGQPAGLGTNTLASSNALFLPILTQESTIGVLRIQPKSHELFMPEQMELLELCINQLAMALEVDTLHEKAKHEELKIEMDRAHTLWFTIFLNH